MTSKSKPAPHQAAPASTPIPASIAAPASTKATTAASTTSDASPLAALVASSGSSNARQTKVDRQAQYQAIINGLRIYYKPTDTFQIEQGTVSREALIGQFQGFVSACQTTQAANQEWRAAVQAEHATEGMAKNLRKAVRGIVQARFGANGAPMLKFGYALPKSSPKTTESKAIAAVKGQATRVARGTMTKAEKKKIKGNVNVALVVTPAGGGQSVAGTSAVTAAANAAAATSNAASATNAGQGQAVPVNTVVAAAAVPTSGAGVAGH